MKNIKKLLAFVAVFAIVLMGGYLNPYGLSARNIHVNLCRGRRQRCGPGCGKLRRGCRSNNQS